MPWKVDLACFIVFFTPPSWDNFSSWSVRVTPNPLTASAMGGTHTDTHHCTHNPQPRHGHVDRQVFVFESPKQFSITLTLVVVGEVQLGEHTDFTIRQIAVNVIEIDRWNHLYIRLHLLFQLLQISSNVGHLCTKICICGTVLPSA